MRSLAEVSYTKRGVLKFMEIRFSGNKSKEGELHSPFDLTALILIHIRNANYTLICNNKNKKKTTRPHFIS